MPVFANLAMYACSCNVKEVNKIYDAGVVLKQMGICRVPASYKLEIL